MTERDDDRSRLSMPSEYDRQLAALHDLPDVLKAKSAIIRSVPTLGIGGTQAFVVTTYRQAERGDILFLEVIGAETIRLVLPPEVTRTIQRQHDALSARARSKAMKAVAADRKARGELPGFMKGRKPKESPS